MYTSTEDARSDLFLSGAVYLIGPTVIEILVNLLNLADVDSVMMVLAVLMPIATTALVPFLLMRYRNESFGQYGYGAGLPPNFGIGLLLASPIIIAGLLGATLAGDPLAGIGIGEIIRTGAAPASLLGLLIRLLSWLGLGFLAAYATVKARDAFRSDFRTVRDETIGLGKVLAAVAAVAVSLALLLLPQQLGGSLGLSLMPLLLLPVGVAGSVVLLLRTLRGPSATSRAIMLTPVVLLAVGQIDFSFDIASLALSVWRAAMYAAVGLIIGALQESRRSALAGLGLTLAIAVLSRL
jgi:hypothetical protein